MRYFLVNIDTGYTNVPRLMDVYKSLPGNGSRPPCVENLEKRTILSMKTDENTIYTDFLSESLFLVSEKAKECISLYEPNMQFKEIVLLDKRRKVMKQYFLPVFFEVSCLTQNSEFTFGRYELKKIEIDETKLNKKTIFKIAGVEKNYIVARVDLVESLLRRGVKGIDLEEIRVIS